MILLFLHSMKAVEWITGEVNSFISWVLSKGFTLRLRKQCNAFGEYFLLGCWCILRSYKLKLYSSYQPTTYWSLELYRMHAFCTSQRNINGAKDRYQNSNSLYHWLNPNVDLFNWYLKNLNIYLSNHHVINAMTATCGYNFSFCVCVESLKQNEATLLRSARCREVQRVAECSWHLAWLALVNPIDICGKVTAGSINGSWWLRCSVSSAVLCSVLFGDGTTEHSWHHRRARTKESRRGGKK